MPRAGLFRILRAMPFPLYLALAYLRPRRSFASAIPVITVLGVTLGVAILMIVLAVMTGFGDVWREKILSFKPHIVVAARTPDGVVADPEAVCRAAEAVPGVASACPAIVFPAMIRSDEGGDPIAVTVVGIDPDRPSILRNAASEPHIQELCHLLNKMGAKISNIGSNVLTIEGVESLHSAEFTIGPDYLEVVSYIGAAAMTHGEVMIRNAGNEYLNMVSLVFNRIGVRWETIGDDILVPENQRLTVEPDLGGAIPEISVMPWPGFPSDLMSIAIVMATQVTGSILFHDWMYPSRMYFTDKLVGMGAQIVLCDPHRCIVQGPTRLYPENLESPDIRAGMALLLATLTAPGKSTIRNIGQIERGYERVDEKLAALGAKISRI